MHPFVMNGDVWRPIMVDPGDPRLWDRTGSSRVATTDPETMCVYLSRELHGAALEVVMLHEAAHCAMVSYGLLDHLHAVVPEEAWVPVEEWACNLIANHGADVFHAVNVAMGHPGPHLRGGFSA